jgi:tRNA nucleotidyltransferase (CCA-adding enzyme)
MLDLPVSTVEWAVTGADAAQMITAGFTPMPNDATRFRHEQTGDIYQLARHQYYDPAAARLVYRCDPGVSLESELATRPITLLAMANDAGDIIDPFEGQEDMIDGLLRHVTPHFIHVPANLLVVSVWASRLAHWGFSVAHGTHGLMKEMTAEGALAAIPSAILVDAVLQALAAPQPSAFFRVLHRCGALREISAELDSLYGRAATHQDVDTPQIMQRLDRVCSETQNLSHVIRIFHDALGELADPVFSALGLDSLFRSQQSG